MISRLLIALSCCLSLLAFGMTCVGSDTCAFHLHSSPNTKTLRVMTYNIQHGAGTDQKLNLPRIAEVIRREHPDLVGLQEVDRGVERTNRADEIVELARLTKMEYAFAYNLHYQGGQYGVAVLSRWPILSIDHRRYANRREAERRGFIRVRISVGGKVLDFITTHLDYQYEDGRQFEIEQLLKALEGISSSRTIIVGDFNAEPTSNSYKMMRARFEDAWEINNEASGLSYPAIKPIKRIDYIFYPKGAGLSVRRTWVVNTLASDHLPVIADMEIEGHAP